MGEWHDIALLAWIFSLLLKTSLSAWWDVYQDWDLPERVKADQFTPAFSKWFYFWCCGSNLLLRGTWAISLTPQGVGIANLNTIFAGMEIMRRTQWAVLRVENESCKKTYYERLLGQSFFSDQPLSIQRAPTSTVERRIFLSGEYSNISDWPGIPEGVIFNRER